MQYLVSEIKAGASPSGESRVFDPVSDAVRHIQKTTAAKTLWIDDREKTIDQIEWILREKLSTVSLLVGEARKKWSITAF